MKYLNLYEDIKWEEWDDEDEDDSELGIGDRVRFRSLEMDKYVPDFYTDTEADCIPRHSIIHGRVQVHPEYEKDCKIVDLYDDGNNVYYIVRYKGYNDLYVQLGFLENDLELI